MTQRGLLFDAEHPIGGIHVAHLTRVRIVDRRPLPVVGHAEEVEITMAIAEVDGGIGVVVAIAVYTGHRFTVLINDPSHDIGIALSCCRHTNHNCCGCQNNLFHHLLIYIVIDIRIHHTVD